jgi:predicted DNA-binding transcriptional regulator
MSRNDNHDRDRDDSGRYVETLTADRVLEYLHRADEPMTATELADEFDVTNRALLNKLNALHERGAVERKEVGARAVVWWATSPPTPPEDANSLADVVGGGGMLEGKAGEKFADAVRSARAEMNESMEERADALFGE